MARGLRDEAAAETGPHPRPAGGGGPRHGAHPHLPRLALRGHAGLAGAPAGAGHGQVSWAGIG